MAAQLTPQQWHELLEKLLLPNTEIVIQATKELQNYIRTIHCLSPLFILIKGGNGINPGVRQLAALLLKKRIPFLWSKIKDEDIANLQRELTALIVTEQISVIRTAIANLIATIARLTVPYGKWNDLFVFLLSLTKSQEPHHREVAMNLFHNLTETIGKDLQPHFNTLRAVIREGLQDPADGVRLASLKAVGVLFEWMEPSEFALVEDLIAPIVQMMKFCLEKELNDDILNAFDVFEEFIGQGVPAFKKYSVDITGFVLQIAGAATVDMPVRQRALTFVETLADVDPKTIIRNGMVPAILNVLFNMGAEITSDEDFFDETSPLRFSAQTLRELSSVIAPKHLFQPAIQMVNQYGTSQSANHKSAAIVLLSTLCDEYVSQTIDLLPQLVPFLCASCSDTNPFVREASFLALARFSSQLQPDILDYSSSILPLILNSLSDPSDNVKLNACYALQGLCDGLTPDDFSGIAETLMTKLVHLLHTGNFRLKEIVIPAFGSAATALDHEFMRYFDVVIKALREILVQRGDQAGETLVLRARAIECVGVIAVAVGPKYFSEALIDEFMRFSIDVLKTEEDYEYREETYHFFSNIATVLKEKFSVFLPSIVEQMLTSVESDGGIIEKEGEKKADIFSGLNAKCKEGDDDEDEEDIEDSEDEGDVNYSVQTTFIEEKRAAVIALGHFASVCPRGFLPYVQRTTKALENIFSYFHEDVRMSAVKSIVQMLESINACYPPAQPWVKHQPHVLSNETKLFTEYVCPLLITVISDDNDSHTVTSACNALVEMMRLVGPASIQPYLLGILTALEPIFDQSAQCLANPIDEEETENVVEDDDSERDLEIIDAATECLVELAKVLGPSLESLFKGVFPKIAKYLTSSFPASYQSIMIGSIGEISNEFGPVFAPYFEQFFRIAFEMMIHSPDRDLRRNATYTVGTLLQAAPQTHIAEVYPRVLEAVGAFVKPGADKGVSDNACGIIAKMILSHPEAISVPTAVPLLISGLPLKIDFEPTTNVFLAIFKIFEQFPDVAMLHISDLAVIFAKSLIISKRTFDALASRNNHGHDHKTEWERTQCDLCGRCISLEIRGRIKALLRTLFEKFAEAMRDVVTTRLDQGEQAEFTALMQEP